MQQEKSHLAPRLSRVVAKERLRVLLSLVTANSLPPHICAPSDDSLGASQRRGRRTDIQVEDGLTGGLRLSRVVVDDVSDLLLFTVDISGDEPVMAIEWKFSSDYC